MPTEAEMLPKDKYTMFDRKEKRYRKGIHSTSIPALWRASVVAAESLCRTRGHRTEQRRELRLTGVFTELPKWTRVSQRLNPPGY